MALSDLFYPGNPERREKVIRKSQELIILMRNSFEATNELIEVVNEHLHSSFRLITLDEKATVSENCDVMIECVNQIQAKVQEVDEELKKKLEPSVYEKLPDVLLHSKDSSDFWLRVKKAVSAVCQLSGIILVRFLMKHLQILTNITSALGKIATIVGGIFPSMIFGLAVDAIVSAILGNIERKQLKTALAEYEEVLKELRPALKQYNYAINEIKFMLKYKKKE